jgi:hypothetical protein
MSVDFFPYVFDPGRGTWGLPARFATQVLELNLSNANAADLLNALGLPSDQNAEPMPIEAFSGLVTAALRRHLGKRSPELPPITDTALDRITLVDCGRSEGYIERRLGDLAMLVHQGRAIGATHIGWG